MPVRILIALIAFATGAQGSLSILFDYTYDGGFFSGVNSGRRALLEAAAGVFTDHLPDATFDPVVANGTNHWSLQIVNPATTTTIELQDPALPADTLKIYVGGRDLEVGMLGVAATPGWTASGDSSWLDLLQAKNSTTHFEPLGGSISFDNLVKWYFDPNPLTLEPFGGKYDFFSVAQHEIAHLLGFSSETAAFAANSSAGQFVGPNATTVYGGPIPLSADGSHWAENLTFDGAFLDMDPAIPTNTRTNFSSLEFAVLKDIGYNSPTEYGALTISTADPSRGTVSKKFLGTTSQELGRQLAVQAMPKTGYVFAGWTGDIVSEENPLYFVMKKGLSFEANFIVSPFINCEGNFYGIFESDHAETNGNWTIKCDVYGVFSGFILLDGVRRPIHGHLDSQGHWNKTFSDGVVIDFYQNLTSGGIAGTLALNGVTAQFAGEKLPVHTKLNPSPLAGAYTIALRPEEPAPLPAPPRGTGSATAKISNSGKARLAGRLADGTTMSAAIPLNSQNEVALSARFSNDYLEGTMNFAEVDSAGDVTGEFVWSRHPRSDLISKWPEGFDSTIAVIGNRWIKPAARTPLLSALQSSNGMASVELSSAEAVIETTVFISDRNSAIESPPSAHLLKLLPMPSSGLLRGSFLDANSTRVAFHGVFLQKQMVAEGYFVDGNVRLAPAP